MKLLLDTHIVVAVVHRELSRYPAPFEAAVQAPENDKVVSAASFWEAAIKNRLGKLTLLVPIEAMPDFLAALGFQLLAVDHRHAVEELRVLPGTRDPFDRMLLAQCQLEGLRLVTADRALTAHPLAWVP